MSGDVGVLGLPSTSSPVGSIRDQLQRSALRSPVTVIAAWPGEWSDHSTKVTTLTDADQASELAHALTRLSEGAWDAAAWLDASLRSRPPSANSSISYAARSTRSRTSTRRRTATGTPTSGASPTSRSCWQRNYQR
jgi:hypothetical protein